MTRWCDLAAPHRTKMVILNRGGSSGDDVPLSQSRAGRGGAGSIPSLAGVVGVRCRRLRPRRVRGGAGGWLLAGNAATEQRIGRPMSGKPRISQLRRSLLALGPQVCGDAPRSDYLYLLLCLAFLRLHDQDRWVQLTRAIPPSGDPGDARRLLRRVVAAVDGSLGYRDLLNRQDAPPARLRPGAFEPVRKVMELSADLLPSDFRRLRASFVREARVHGGAICTPTSVTRAMVALLAGHTGQGNVRVYDPFARFGELLAEFVRGCADQAVVQVRIEHPHPADLRLAGVWLAAAGTASTSPSSRYRTTPCQDGRRSKCLSRCTST